MTALATATASGEMLDGLLLRIRSTSIGPNLPSYETWEILHNHTEGYPRHTSHPVNFEHVRNYLINKKATQKKYHYQSHKVKPLPELKPGQQVFFLSPTEQNQYIERTVTTKAATPRSYYLEAQCKTYHHTCQQICIINAPIATITRPYSIAIPSARGKHTTKNSKINPTTVPCPITGPIQEPPMVSGPITRPKICKLLTHFRTPSANT